MREVATHGGVYVKEAAVVSANKVQDGTSDSVGYIHGKASTAPIRRSGVGDLLL